MIVISIATRARRKSYLNVLQAVHIHHDALNLCVQRQFVQTLLLFAR